MDSKQHICSATDVYVTTCTWCSRWPIFISTEASLAHFVLFCFIKPISPALLSFSFTSLLITLICVQRWCYFCHLKKKNKHFFPSAITPVLFSYYAMKLFQSIVLISNSLILISFKFLWIRFLTTPLKLLSSVWPVVTTLLHPVQFCLSRTWTNLHNYKYKDLKKPNTLPSTF